MRLPHAPDRTMERQEIQKLIESLESLKRVTERAADLFDDPDPVSSGWFILDPEER